MPFLLQKDSLLAGVGSLAPGFAPPVAVPPLGLTLDLVIALTGQEAPRKCLLEGESVSPPFYSQLCPLWHPPPRAW